MSVIMLRSWLLAGLMAVTGLVSSTVSTSAQALGAVTGDPVLTVSGSIAKTNVGDSAVFDNALLDALPQYTITTTTPWYEGEKTFEGPLIKDVLAAVKASGKTLTFTALNDYESTLPVSDLAKYNVILARKIDGKMLSVRDKGPLFVIYPFDANPELKTKSYYSRCAWQVTSMKVE
ncbi:MAG: molybdopterin-dependent oxidoreductase [Plesiomonas shigelloides]